MQIASIVFYTCNFFNAGLGGFLFAAFFISWGSKMGQLTKLRQSIMTLFNARQIDESDLDWILVSVLGISRSETRKDRSLTESEIKKISKFAKKRFQGFPLSQVLGEVEFYGLRFDVNRHVLSPRPETELLVEIIKDNESGNRGLDIGTGSGAIAVSLAKLGECKMVAVAVSHRALKVARSNAEKHNACVKFIKSDLFSCIGEEFDFIVSNPPYIKTGDIFYLDTEVKDHEPVLALDGGKTGLQFYERIISDAPKFLVDGGRIYFEVGVGQAGDVAKLLQNEFTNIIIKKDYNNIERIVIATKK